MRKESAFVLLIILVMILLLVSFVSAGIFDGVWAKMHGKVVAIDAASKLSTSEVSTTEGGEVGSDCVDSDGGKDYFNQGTVIIDSRTKTDTCTNSEGTIEAYSSGYVLEFFCEGSEIHYCEYGCLNGACSESDSSVFRDTEIKEYDSETASETSDSSEKENVDSNLYLTEEEKVALDKESYTEAVSMETESTPSTSNFAQKTNSCTYEGNCNLYEKHSLTHFGEYISLIFVDYSSVKFNINGTVTPLLQEGNSYLTNSNNLLTIQNIVYSSSPNVTSYVYFSHVVQNNIGKDSSNSLGFEGENEDSEERRGFFDLFRRRASEQNMVQKGDFPGSETAENQVTERAPFGERFRSFFANVFGRSNQEPSDAAQNCHDLKGQRVPGSNKLCYSGETLPGGSGDCETVSCSSYIITGGDDDSIALSKEGEVYSFPEDCGILEGMPVSSESNLCYNGEAPLSNQYVCGIEPCSQFVASGGTQVMAPQGDCKACKEDCLGTCKRKEGELSGCGTQACAWWDRNGNKNYKPTQCYETCSGTIAGSIGSV